MNQSSHEPDTFCLSVDTCMHAWVRGKLLGRRCQGQVAVGNRRSGEVQVRVPLVGDTLNIRVGCPQGPVRCVRCRVSFLRASHSFQGRPILTFASWNLDSSWSMNAVIAETNEAHRNYSRPGSASITIVSPCAIRRDIETSCLRSQTACRLSSLRRVSITHQNGFILDPTLS